MKDFIKNLVYLLYQNYILSNPNYRVQQFRSPAQTNETENYTLDFIGLAQLQGHQVEWHNVTTEDGYVLSLFRLLPKHELSNSTRKRPAIYLQHPLGADADLYVVFGTGRSLGNPTIFSNGVAIDNNFVRNVISNQIYLQCSAYTLSDAGYDVWLGNCRGTTYSRRHVRLSPDDSEFWNFSMDEYTLVDLATMIDYVLESTGETSISYAGHSLGTTMALMLLSAKVNYGDKLNAVVLLAPIAYWKSKTVGSYILTTNANLLNFFLPSATEIQFQTCALTRLFETLCLINDITIRLCRIPFHLILGNDDEQFSVDQSPRLFLYYPTGISVKLLYHYSQHVMTGYMRYYNYVDEESNMKYYGNTEPPIYNVSKIRAPLVLLSGEVDQLATKDNIEELIKRLPANSLVVNEVIDKFNHGDFLLAKDVEKLAYHRILEILQKLV